MSSLASSAAPISRRCCSSLCRWPRHCRAPRKPAAYRPRQCTRCLRKHSRTGHDYRRARRLRQRAGSEEGRSWSLWSGDQLALNHRLDSTLRAGVHTGSTAGAQFLVNAGFAVHQSYGLDGTHLHTRAATRAARHIHPYCLHIHHLTSRNPPLTIQARPMNPTQGGRAYHQGHRPRNGVVCHTMYPLD